MRAAVLLVALLIASSSHEGAQHASRAEQPVTVAHLVTHASAWTARFDQSLSGLLFRERYLQRIRTGPSVERQLEANIFLLRAPGARDFVAYRDVYRVNGRDLTDHTERLQQLLLKASAATHTQARELTNASARHNLPGVFRNVNLPTMPYDYLVPGALRNLKVTIAGTDTVERLDVVIVEFQEIRSPTVVRGTDGSDVFATGRFWIHPPSGAVPRALAEFVTRDRVRGRLEVKLELHGQLQVWVPKEMTETWTAPGREITGLASYDRFQRLNVSTAEIIK